ncbi:MAG: hypothetical protein AAF741_07575 [Bacteroidota bacterium]
MCHLFQTCGKTITSSFYRIHATLLLGMMCFTGLSAQTEVAALSVGEVSRVDFSESENDKIQVGFELISNLIWFEAVIDGQIGHFVLDTGAPTLLLNDWQSPTGQQLIGESADGRAVPLSEGQIESFQLSGVEQGVQRALGLDLSGMESRAGKRLFGMMGFEQLRNYELMIDYEQGRFELLTKKQQKERNEEPVFSIPFRLVDHLPVIRLKSNGQALVLALDSGAGCNLIDRKAITGKLRHTPTGEQTRLHNLSGQAEVVALIGVESLQHRQHELGPQTFAPTQFGPSLFDDIEIDGLLGQPFFQAHRVSIDYRKGRIYFWR